MTENRHETLDETIDRVAAAMTAVPADPSFSERVFDHRDTRAASRVMWAVAVGAAVIVAVVLSRPLQPGGDDVNQPAPLLSLPIASAAPLLAPAAANPAGRAVDTATNVQSTEEAEPFPVVAALQVEDLPVAEDLNLAPLSIAPVDLGLLELSPLDEPKPETSGVFKE